MECNLLFQEVFKVFAFGLGLFLPAFFANKYHIKNQKEQESAFNLNNLILLKSELEEISLLNKKIRKSCGNLIEYYHIHNKVISKFPHSIPFLSLEALISNLIQYPKQDPELLKLLIKLKTNVLMTNESLNFSPLHELKHENEAIAFEDYIKKVNQYLDYTDQILENLFINLEKR